MRKFLLIILVLVWVCPATGANLMNTSTLNMRKVEDMNMTGLLPAYVNASTFAAKSTEAPDYNLAQMKSINPDFTTYPETAGIIWRKHAIFSQHGDGGLEVVRQYVILGRKGLSGNWLSWKIPIPNDGTAEILEASAYDFDTLANLAAPSLNTDTANSIITVNFSALPDTYVMVVSWRESLPTILNVEGVSYFQEDLRVWESICEVHSPQTLSYRAFPAPMSPEVDRTTAETVYTWRRINLDPFAAGLARPQRSGVAFSSRRGKSAALSLIRDAEALAAVPAPKSPKGADLIAYLKARPEITLAEGFPRKIPADGALTRAEKTILARSWLSSQKINASLSWRLPYELDDMSPVCAQLFTDPVLDVQGVKGLGFHDMTDPKLLGGTKLYSVNSAGQIFSRKIPEARASDNRLSAIMDLQLTEYGQLNGTVRVILRGGWGAFLLGESRTEGTARGALLSLFPGLTNYKDVKLTDRDGTPELLFTVENKPGVGGTGQGVLAILPFFEPVAMRRLGGQEPPIELQFPFVIDQNITLGFPKGAEQALVSGKVSRNPDKINYSESYMNRRHRLIAEAQLTVNMPTITAGNLSLLRRHLDNWRAFSARQIPVR